MFREEELSTLSAVYGLTCKARCLSAVVADQDNVRFLVGTQTLKDNEVHLVEVQDEEDRNDIKCMCIYPHPSEIWNLAPCPSDAKRFISCYNQISNNNSSDFKATLWEMKEEDSTLFEVADFPDHVGEIKCALWNPNETSKSRNIITIDEGTLRQWKIDNSIPKLAGTIAAPRSKKYTTGCCSSIHPEQIITANENSVHGFDLRSLKETYSINNAHSPFVRDLDFNPYKDYFLVTGGDDYRIKFWDTRRTDAPLKIIPSHNHWVWNVKYNRYHDQLVLSSSTDSTVNLWNVFSMSSHQQSNQEKLEQQSRKDRLIKTYEEHEDSVYSISWATSAWIFASLSYEGRLVVNRVPNEVSDAILLDDE